MPNTSKQAALNALHQLIDEEERKQKSNIKLKYKNLISKQLHDYDLIRTTLTDDLLKANKKIMDIVDELQQIDKQINLIKECLKQCCVLSDFINLQRQLTIETETFQKKDDELKACRSRKRDIEEDLNKLDLAAKHKRRMLNRQREEELSALIFKLHTELETNTARILAAPDIIDGPPSTASSSPLPVTSKRQVNVSDCTALFNAQSQTVVKDTCFINTSLILIDNSNLVLLTFNLDPNGICQSKAQLLSALQQAQFILPLLRRASICESMNTVSLRIDNTEMDYMTLINQFAVLVTCAEAIIKGESILPFLPNDVEQRMQSMTTSHGRAVPQSQPFTTTSTTETRPSAMSQSFFQRTSTPSTSTASTSQAAVDAAELNYDNCDDFLRSLDNFLGAPPSSGNDVNNNNNEAAHSHQPQAKRGRKG